MGQRATGTALHYEATERENANSIYHYKEHIYYIGTFIRVVLREFLYQKKYYARVAV